MITSDYSTSAIAVAAHHRSWHEALPKQPGDLWVALQGFDGDSRQALFAHCVAHLEHWLSASSGERSDH